MKLKFKVQPYQTNAVEAVVDCFAGQPHAERHQLPHRPRPPGADRAPSTRASRTPTSQLTDLQVLANIQAVQRRQNLPLSRRR